MGHIPIEVYAFGHSFGDIRVVSKRFGATPEGRCSFKNFLVKFGFLPKIAKQVSDNPTCFAYSNLLNFIILQKDPNMQKLLCDILSKVTVVQDPTENMVRFAKLHRHRICLG